jgi:hypothetical protein
METKRLKSGKTVTGQLRMLKPDEVLEVNFTEKLPHILYGLCHRLDKIEGIKFSVEVLSDEGISLVRRITTND